MFTSNDMVYYKEKDKIQSGGMKVNSILLKNGDPLGYSKKGGTIPNMLGDLVVPVGLIYLQEHLNKRMNKEPVMQLNSEPIPDSLYDKLLGIDNTETKSKKKGKTTKQRKNKNKNKKTRKK
tara:strand:+ start:120 stop:482 length:363 start_codon:yes stop_codon:yes gene_type:complete